ncbi:hypothetical protein [Thermococcus sp.]
MKKALSIFLILILGVVLSSSGMVSASYYTVPGTSPEGLPYNNIGILGEIMIDLNVTLINTAPYPKFVVVNPRYDFIVHRNNDSERLINYRVGGVLKGNITIESLKHSLNYLIGFWLDPYESVVVTFRINSNASYVLNLEDYNGPCKGINKITSLTYENGTLQSLEIIRNDELDKIVCSGVYPQIINKPMFLSFRSMFPLLGRDVKVLKYRGKVTMRLTNVPNYYNKDKFFRSIFAVVQPIVFLDGQTYNYTPMYTMTYDEYLSTFVWSYVGLEKPHLKKSEAPVVESTLFRLTPTLISGVSITQRASPEVENNKFAGLKLPVWIILLGDRAEISYFVRWDSG